MSNFLSSEDTSKLIENQKNAILTEYGVTDIKQLTDEQVEDMREKYAGYLNYEYSNGKMYTYEDGQKVEVVKTEDEVF
jgi:ribonuclease HIII